MDLLQPKGNIIALIVFLQLNKHQLKIRDFYAAADCPVHVDGDPLVAGNDLSSEL